MPDAAGPPPEPSGSSGSSGGAVPVPHRHSEPRWPATLAILVASSLYLVLPNALVLGPRWLVPALEFALLVALTITSPRRITEEVLVLRVMSIAVIALINLANIVSLFLLIHDLVHGRNVLARQLIYSAILVWLTNVIVFGLWFWELDRGGPGRRASGDDRQPDFQFPQMVASGPAANDWRPQLIDYLYVGLTNGTAFSPTDAMPLTPAAKSLMGVEAVVSLVTVTVVAARAINIL